MSSRTLSLTLLLGVLFLSANSCVSDGLGGKVRFGAVTSTGSLTEAMKGVSTFALHPDGRIVGTDHDAAQTSDIRLVVEGAIYNRFERAGYHLVPEEQAERYVAYAVGMTGELTDAALLELFGMTPGLDSDDSLRGGVILAVVNPQAGSISWRSSIGAALEERAATPAERDQRIRVALDALLRELIPER